MSQPNNDENSTFTSETAPVTTSFSPENVLTQLVSNLKDNKLSGNVQFDSWINLLTGYLDGYGHLYYSAMAQVIFNAKLEECKNIKFNIQKIDVRIKNRLENNNIQPEIYDFWLKFKDHTQLTLLQREKYEFHESEIRRVAKETAKEISKKEAEESQKDITGQLIGLVALFTALAFVIFGGISALDSITQVIKETSIMKIAAISVLWALCLFILMYLFMMFILMITNPKKDENNKFLNPFPKQINIIFISIFATLVLLIIGFTILSFINPCLFKFLIIV